MSNDDKFKNFIKNNTDFNSDQSEAELDQIKSFINRKNSFFNPFIPFAVSASLVIFFVFSTFILKKESQIKTYENNLAEEYLFESYFLVEDSLQDEDKDFEYNIF